MSFTPESMFLTLFALVITAVVLLLYRMVKCTAGLEWVDLIATNGAMNAYKIGYWIGVAVGSWAVIKTTYMGDLDAGVFAGYLAFLGGATVGMSAIRTRGEKSERDSRNFRDERGLPPVPRPRRENQERPSP